MKCSAYFLVGPTASGKTDVAHVLARRKSMAVLSIDSMLVYRGMDIGTAKPAAAERAGITYFGIDIVDPDREYNLALFLDYVRAELEGFSGDLIICGGTGLYARFLAEGFDEGPGPDPLLREKWERVVADQGVQALQMEVKRMSSPVFEAMRDKANPRRLIRLLERLNGGDCSVPECGESKQVFAGIGRSAPELSGRIDLRVDRMFACGFVEEVEALLARYGRLSSTAEQAIGYAEVIAMLAGRMPLKEAVARTKVRTRQLAKKQRTWFRHKARVDWVDVRADDSAERAADLIEERWKESGPVMLGLFE